MALRVLLGDESATIKKVIQLALQDYSVEVKSVHLGLDILDVSRTFQPHIIFMDVLLQKKNGYEVCAELKSHPEFADIPVVLMWSSFMSLDEDKFQECGAEVRLEKPFEVDDLRGIVQRYVPLVQENKVAPFLKFSSSITQEFKEEVKQQAAAPQAPAVAPEKQEEALPKQKPHVVAAAPEAPAASELGKSDSGSWSMEDFDKLASLDTEDLSGTHSGLFQSAESDPWSAQNLDEFKVDLQEVDEEEFVITTLEDSPTGSPASLEFTRLEETPEELPTEEGEDLQLSEDWSKIPLPPTQEASVLNPSVKKMVDEYLERAFRSELEARLEKALREMLPELASRVIKEEIRRLTRDLD